MAELQTASKGASRVKARQEISNLTAKKAFNRAQSDEYQLLGQK